MKLTRFNLQAQTITFLFFVVIAFLSYQKNYFGFSDESFFKTFDKGSESLVVANIAADQFDLEKHNWNLGFIVDGDSPLDTNLSFRMLEDKSVASSIRFSVYPSQFGIQGLFFSEVYKFLGKPNLEVLSALNALLMAIVIAALATLYLKIYNKTFAVIFFIVMISSPWVVSFARNIYWVPFTWFLPAVFAALAYLSQRQVMKLCLMACVLLSIAIKSLAGYEYLTTITVFACSVFLLAPLFGRDHGKQGDWIKFSFLTFSLCIIGFIFALSLHASMRGDSIFSGLQNIYHQDVQRRTYGDSSQFDPVYRASLESSFFDVLNTYWSNWNTPLSMFIPGSYLGGLFGIFLIGMVYEALTRRRVSYGGPAMVFVFFAATVSWFFLAKAHSYIHTHLNYVLWYFGFVQALLYCLARFLLLVSLDILKLFKRLNFTQVIISGSVVLLFIAVGPARYIDNRMAVITSGVVEPIDVGSGFKVNFRSDGKMVFYAPKCRDLDLTGRFILHFIPERIDLPIASPHGFENRDFVWPTSSPIRNWNPFSSNFGSCYTEVLLPNYKVNKFRTGQYDVSDAGLISVRWEVMIKMPSFTGLVELSPYNLTDSNWENGISRVRPGFFIPNTVQNRMGLSTNDTIEFPFSGMRAIASIEYTDSYINVYLDGGNLDPTRDGYPNKFTIKP